MSETAFPQQDFTPAGKPKRKVGKIILIAALSLVLLFGISAAAVFCVPAINNQFMMLVLNPAEYYQHVEKKANTQLAKDISALYAQGKTLQNKTKASQETLQVKVFQQALSAAGLDIGEDITISITATGQQENGTIYAKGSISLNGQELLNGIEVYQTEEKIIFYVPDLYDKYLYLDASKLAKNLPAEEIQNGISGQLDLSKCSLTEKEMEQLITDYSNILIEMDKEVSIQKGVKGEVGDIAFTYNTVTAKITADDLTKAVKKLLETAKKDARIEELAKAFGITKETLTKGFEDMLKQMNEDTAKENNTEKNELQLVIYTDAAGNITGREMVAKTDDKEVFHLTYLSAGQDNKGAQELVITADKTEIKLVNTFTADKMLYSGKATFTVQTEGEKAESIMAEYKDISLDAETPTGTVTITIPPEITKGEAAVIKITMAGGEKQTISLKVTVGQTDYVEITATSEDKTAEKITVPELNSQNSVDITGEGMYDVLGEITQSQKFAEIMGILQSLFPMGPVFEG